MKPNPPLELEKYQYDHKSSQLPLYIRVLGWLSLLLFVAGIYAFVFLSNERMIMMCYIFYGAFITLFITYIIARMLRRHSRCSKCQQIMDVIDVKWTPDQWQQIQGYEQLDSLNGADGYLYTTDIRKETGSAPYCTIWVQLQIWCACHQCRLYFLKAQHSRRQIFASRNDDKFEKAKRLLLTLPNACEELEAAYKASYDSLGDDG